MFPFRCSTSCLSENPVYAFRTIRAIFAEGLNPVSYTHLVTVDGPKITLRNASLKIGHSDMVATGEVMGLYRAMTKNETLKARLAISSEMIDCNQLINSFSLSEEISVGRCA